MDFNHIKACIFYKPCGICVAVKKEEFEKITVKEIAKRADVSRKTFYMYYKDKYYLMSQIEQDFIDDFKSTLYESDFYTLLQKKDTFLKTILEYIKEHEKHCYAILCYHNSTDLFQQIEKIAIQYIKDNAEEELIDKESQSGNVHLSVLAFHFYIMQYCYRLIGSFGLSGIQAYISVIFYIYSVAG
ncbi:TetR/AcrR family transcriptional regulator [Muricomes intestini]|jgi:AcrR family transcriptional regulator|uniref:TetR/AcrR family transcriptional regulator n=1 Tax=Muricomes intestini TaxID=1796634 RepID=UPI002FDE42C2